MTIANSPAAEALRAHQRIDDHEDHCGERWKAANETMKELRKSVAQLEKRWMLFAGAIIGAEFLAEGAGPLVSAIIGGVP